MLDEVVVTEHELDDALARTLSRHAELRHAQVRRRRTLGGLGAAVVVAVAVLIPVLASGDDQPVRTTDPATADVPATRPSPTTTLAATGGDVGIDTATQSRRTAEVHHTISAGGTVAILTFGCETGGDRIGDFASHFEGTVLHVSVTIDTDNVASGCPSANSLDRTVPIPADVQGQPITVVVDHP